MTLRRHHGWPKRRVRAASGSLWPPVVASLLLSSALLPFDPDTASPSLALLPALAFYRWAKSAPAALVCPLAAASGATLDVLAHGPLGFWALIYACACAFGLHARSLGNAGPAVNLALVATHVLALAGLAAALTALCTFAQPNWHLLIREASAALIFYPLIALSMGCAAPVLAAPRTTR